MRLREFQDLVVRVMDEIDLYYPGRGHSNSLLCLAHGLEEMGEVARQIYNEAQGRDDIDIENLGEEIVDVYFALGRIAESYHIDLEDAVRKKVDKLRERYGLKNA